MLADVASLLLTLGALCYAMAARPTRAICPPTWRVGGAFADGSYACERPYGCVDRENVRGGYASECDGMITYRSRLYCTGGERPVVGDGEVVGCQR